MPSNSKSPKPTEPFATAAVGRQSPIAIVCRLIADIDSARTRASNGAAEISLALRKGEIKKKKLDIA